MVTELKFCGIIGAWVNNSVGMASASYNVGIIPMRVVDTSGQGSTQTVVMVIASY